jgi:hypothetical protein
MKRIISAVTILIVIVVFAACKKTATAPPNTANVTFVDGCAGTTSVDVSVGMNKLSGATNIAFQKSSGYKGIPAGSDSIAFILANLGTPVETTTRTFTAGSNYSIFLGGMITSPTLVFLNDDLSAPPSGYAKIRFVNLTTDTAQMTAYAGTTVIASNVGYQGATSFMQIAAGAYIIKAGETNNISTVVVTGSQQLSSGKIYTAMLTGTLNGSGQSAFIITLLSSN